MTGYQVICPGTGRACQHLRKCAPYGVCEDGARAAEAENGHNHGTRELRPQGMCRACDEARKWW